MSNILPISKPPIKASLLKAKPKLKLKPKPKLKPKVSAKPAPQRKLPSAPTCLVTIAGQQKRINVKQPPADLELAITELTKLIAKHPGEQCDFEANKIFQWPEHAQNLLLRVMQQARFPKRIRLRHDHSWQKDIFEASLAAISHSDKVGGIANMTRLAVQAACLSLSKAEVGLAFQKITKRCQDVGIKGVTLKQLGDMAQGMSTGLPRSPAEDDPAKLAKDFLAALIQLTPDELGQAIPEFPEVGPAVYYREEIYLRGRNCYVRTTQSSLERDVAAWLGNRRTGITANTSRVRDIQLNIKAQAWKVPATEELPVWMSGSDQAAPTTYLALANGMIDLSSGSLKKDTLKLQDYDPHLFCEYALPFDFNPQATCPLWEETLLNILPGKEVGDQRIQVLQEFFGYCLLPSHVAPRLEKFLILDGKGSNGKSTVLTMLEELLGTTNVVNMSIQQLSDKFQAAELRGKLANVCYDLSSLAIKDCDRLKTLVSGDSVSAERKYLSNVTFRNRAKLVFSTNRFPSIQDISDGFWRRPIVMPFDTKFTEEQADTGRIARLRQELPGILNWALVGARRLLRRQRFTQCSVCSSALAKQRGCVDSIGKFIDEYCLLDPKQRVRRSELWASYERCCADLGREPELQQAFNDRITDLPDVKAMRLKKQNRTRIWQGITLRTES